MMRLLCGIALFTSFALSKKIIFDADTGFAFDDIHSLGTAHYLADQGHCEILGTFSSTAFHKSVATMNVVNTYFGRPDIQLGAFKGHFGREEMDQDSYCTQLLTTMPTGGITSSAQVPDAVTGYKKILNAQEDNSVTLIVVGFPINVRDVLQADARLFGKKVKEVYWMNGFYNFGCGRAIMMGEVADCYAATKYAVENIPDHIPQYFQLNGYDICVGGPLLENGESCRQNDKNPLKASFIPIEKFPPECNGQYASWDPITVYAAVMGTEAAGMYEVQGRNHIDEEGRESFDYGDMSANHFDLMFINDEAKIQIQKVLDDILCLEHRP